MNIIDLIAQNSGVNIWKRLQNYISSQNSGDILDLNSGKLTDINLDDPITLANILNTFLLTTDQSLVGAINELKNSVDAISGGLIFKGSISVASDFPTIADVRNGWLYSIAENVTDNDVSKTNTGQSFSQGEQIAWNGTSWSVIATAIWKEIGTDITPVTSGSNLNLGSGGLKDTNVISKISLGDSSNTETTTTNKTVIGSINELNNTKLNKTGDGSGLTNLSKSQVGLSNVDNTSDASKNVLSATKLTTARNIAGSSFDGSANINIDHSNLSNLLGNGQQHASSGEISAITHSNRSSLDVINQNLSKTDTPEFNGIKLSGNNVSLENFIRSSGVCELPTFVDNGNGTATIGNVECHLYNTTDFSGRLENYTVSGNTFSFTDGAEEYICINYNGGSPVLYKETNKYLINKSSIILVFVCWRQGNTIHSIDDDAYGCGLSEKTLSRFINTDPYKRSIDGGLIINESTSPANRTITCTSSIIYAGVNPIQVLSFDSSTDNMYEVTSVDGVWSYTKVLVYNNTKYNPSSGPVDFPANKYATRWFYRSIGDVKDVFYVLGTTYYNRYSDAETENPPSVPIILRDHCILIGKSIIQYNVASGVTVSAFNIVFSGFGTINHDDTQNIQGGSIDAYYHSDQPINKNSSVEFATAKFGDVANSNYSDFESTGIYHANGNALTWNDINISAYALGTGSAAPALVQILSSGNVYGLGFSGTNVIPDQLFGSAEILHDWYEGSSIYFHVHWMPSDNNSGNVKWQLEYSIVDIGSTFSAPTTITTTESTTSTAWKHLKSPFGAISMTGFHIGCAVIFRLFRDATDSSDTYTGNAILIQVGIHYQKDTLGSRSISTK